MFRLPVIDGGRREEKQGRQGKKIADKFKFHRTQQGLFLNNNIRRGVEETQAN